MGTITVNTPKTAVTCEGKEPIRFSLTASLTILPSREGLVLADFQLKVCFLLEVGECLLLFWALVNCSTLNETNIFQDCRWHIIRLYLALLPRFCLEGRRVHYW